MRSDAQTWDPSNPTQRLGDQALSTSVAALYAMDNALAPYVSYAEPF